MANQLYMLKFILTTSLKVMKSHKKNNEYNKHDKHHFEFSISKFVIHFKLTFILVIKCRCVPISKKNKNKKKNQHSENYAYLK